MRTCGQHLLTLPRNFRSTSARSIGRPAQAGTESTSRVTRCPSLRIAVRRTGITFRTRAVSAGPPRKARGSATGRRRWALWMGVMRLPLRYDPILMTTLLSPNASATAHRLCDDRASDHSEFPRSWQGGRRFTFDSQ